MQPNAQSNQSPEDAPARETDARETDAAAMRDFGIDLVAENPARVRVRLFSPALTANSTFPDARAECDLDGDAARDAPVVALVEPSLGNFDPAHYAASIAGEICRRQSLRVEHLVFIARDRFRLERMADWTILLGPLETFLHNESLLQGEAPREAFTLVAFAWNGGALTRAHATEIARADVEELVGGRFS